MASIAVLKFDSLAQFHELTGLVRPGDAVRLRFNGSVALEEAAELHRALGDWPVEQASRDLLRRAAKYHDFLGAVEGCLEVGEFDMNRSKALPRNHFDLLRSATNKLCLSAPDDPTALRVLEDVVIDAQRVGRLARALQFGEDDTDAEHTKLADDDLEWLISDGDALLAITDGGGGGDGDGFLLAGVDSVEAFTAVGNGLADDNPFALLADLGDGDGEVEALATKGAALALAAQAPSCSRSRSRSRSPSPSPSRSPSRSRWIHMKQNTVAALLGIKVRKLLEAIHNAKTARVTL